MGKLSGTSALLVGREEAATVGGGNEGREKSIGVAVAMRGDEVRGVMLSDGKDRVVDEEEEVLLAAATRGHADLQPSTDLV